MAEMHELEIRVNQFRAMRLPGQPLGMHMGTLSLVNDLCQRVADLERQNALLRAVAEAAQAVMGEARQDEIAGSAYCVIGSDYLLNLHGFTQAAIDGGALGGDNE